MEEEAAYFVECVGEHQAEVNPCEPLNTYEVEYDIRSLRELRLFTKKVSEILATVRKEKGKIDQEWSVC